MAGVDEVGRGAWAGPVVAAAVVLPPNCEIPRGLRDSKLLTPKRREELDEEIRALAVCFAVGSASVAAIEKKGIAVATQIAMRGALRRLSPEPDFYLIDYFTLKHVNKSTQQAVKKGDVYCASIAAASVVAKVYRDGLMRRYDDSRDLKGYRFGRHKGYGTKRHQEAIKVRGLCKIHRVSFIPEKLLN